MNHRFAAAPARRAGIVGVLGLLFFLSAIGAQEFQRAGAEEPLTEFWEAVYLQGAQIGYLHGRYTQSAPGLIDSHEELKLTVQRFGQPMQMGFVMTMRETSQGQVRSFTHRQSLGSDQQLVRSGTVDNGRLQLSTILGGQPGNEKEFPWDARSLGLYAQQQLYAKREMKPGLKFDFRSFVPEFNTILSTSISVEAKQPTDLLGGRKVPFWRVTAQVQDVRDIRLPPMICWVNDSGEIYKREQNIPGLGDLTFYRTSRERALRQPDSAPDQADIGTSQLVRINRGIPSFNETREVLYRVRLAGAGPIEKAFVQDERQKIKVVGKEELQITVRAQDRPGGGPPPPLSPPLDKGGKGVGAGMPKEIKEFLRSNHFITCADEQVQGLARTAVAGAVDPWDKAVRIESWIRRNMTNRDYGKAFATAAETAKSLDGDCTEHAVLAAAMCRAAGVPSRTAIGLIHVPQERAMCFHMWFEVWIAGRWYALDGTLGQGKVGAGHVKVIDAHWNDTDSFLPLLPVVRILGKLKMDVLSVEYQPGVP